MNEELLKEKIAQAIRETLVISNKQSLPKAVDKIIKLFNTQQND